MITAGIGIAVNGFTVVLLSNGKEHDLNVKSAYLHMLADTMVSCGVVISGALIMFSQWTWIDPLIGLFIAGLILRTSWSGFRESMILILDGVPHQIDTEQLRRELSNIDNVDDIHHIHIWAISTTENALTAHVKLRDMTLLEKTKKDLKALLHQLHISHPTLEFESGENCCDRCC